MYRYLIRPIVFGINPESANRQTLSLLKFSNRIPLINTIRKWLRKKNEHKLKKELFGITFPNPIGSGPGINPDAEYCNELSSVGFGFVEIGPLTPKAQCSSKDMPRILPITQDKALIERLNAENKGIHNIIKNLKAEKPDTVIAANITQQRNSVNEDLSKDYEKSFSLIYDFVDMFILNICPAVGAMSDLLETVSEVGDRLLDLRMYFDDYRPILIKISIDTPRVQIDEIIDYCMRSGIDGVVVSDRSKGRKGLTISEEKVKQIGDGFLMGAPVYEQSLAVVKYIYEKTGHSLPIIAGGGVMSPEQAKEMLDSGASLIELSAAFFYDPKIVRKTLKYLSTK